MATNTPLLAARLESGRKQNEVAAGAGVDATMLSRWERATTTHWYPTRDAAARLAAYYRQLGIEINELQILYPERYTKKRRA